MLSSIGLNPGIEIPEGEKREKELSRGEQGHGEEALSSVGTGVRFWIYDRDVKCGGTH